jgi:hypothetical protein
VARLALLALVALLAQSVTCSIVVS